MEFDLVDTGGLEDGAESHRAARGMPWVILQKTEEAILEADVILFVVDARNGMTEADKHYAR
ncbi:unnamed protein product [Discosporangium mesarthrocarpum]